MNMSFTPCQIKIISAKDHSKNYMKDRPPLVLHLLRDSQIKYEVEEAKV